MTGESYGGHYIPVVSHHIWRTNKAKPEGERINLAGFAIGNGLCASAALESLLQAHVTNHKCAGRLASLRCFWIDCLDPSAGGPGAFATLVPKFPAGLAGSPHIPANFAILSLQDGAGDPVRRLQRLCQTEGPHHSRPSGDPAAGTRPYTTDACVVCMSACPVILAH